MFIDMIRTMIQVISNIRIRDVPKPLGRWGHNCEVSTRIKSALANHDCCGDRLCGNPYTTKKMINNELSNR